MFISIFLKFGEVKHLKKLYNVTDVKNSLAHMKIFEKINILLFLIQILIKNEVSFCLPKCFMVH